MSAIEDAWPWKELNPSPNEMRLVGGRCEKWAQKIRKAIGGELMMITPKANRGRYIGPVRTRKGTLISTEFRDHYAVRLGNRIYDRITGPDGMRFEEYKTLFEYADELDFTEG